MSLIRTKPRNLLPRERRFYKLFLTERYSQLECARRAGYSIAIARGTAYELVRRLRELVSRLGYSKIQAARTFFPQLAYVHKQKLYLKS